MSLRGQHEHSLDAKDRVTIPSGLRHAFAEGCTMVASVDECIEVYPRGLLKEVEHSGLTPLGRMSKDARRMRRRMYGSSEETELDSAGRIRMPKHLLAHAGLTGACTVVGAGEYIEIWNPETWAIESGEISEGAEALNERASLFEQASTMQAETR